MSGEKNCDRSTLVKSNSSSSSGGDSKQDVEPVEVTLPLNIDNQADIGDNNTDIQRLRNEDDDTEQASDNRPLLEDLNVNPHHNAPDECLECSCDEALLKENMENITDETKAKKLCKNCSLEKVRYENRTEIIEVNSNNKSVPDNVKKTEIQSSKETVIRNHLEPNIVITESSIEHQESGTESEQSPVKQLQEESDSALNFTVDADDIEPIMTQPLPMTATVSNYCPPGLEDLLEVCQLIIHKSNFRKNIDISKTAVAKLEVVDISRKVVLFAEREPPPISAKSFVYKLYNAQQKPVMEVYCPLGKTCVCCGATWHMCSCCNLQAMVSAPPGQIIGFIKRQHTRFVQEYHILNPSEDLIFILRGGPLDLEIYTPTLGDELGRVAVHNWVGIMREIKRSAEDYGITFPMDLDVRVKATLLGAVFLLDWIFTTKAGRR